jgi:hypothetical protein
MRFASSFFFVMFFLRIAMLLVVLDSAQILPPIKKGRRDASALSDFWV